MSFRLLQSIDEIILIDYLQFTKSGTDHQELGRTTRFPKPVGDGRLAPKIGGRWEVGPKNRWEIGPKTGGRWGVGLQNRWEMGGLLKTGGRWEVGHQNKWEVGG